MNSIIKIFRGDSTTLTETISGLTSLSGYSAKLYIMTLAGVELDTIEGSIAALVITYEIVNESSKAYAVGKYNFESKLFDTSDHVYTSSYGEFVVNATLEEDPV